MIRVGTRNSKLALTQTKQVLEILKQQNPGIEIEIKPLVTSGDIRRDKFNLNVQDKKQWILEIEQQLLAGDIDIAVHCAKDVPLDIEKGTELLTILKRANFADVLLLKKQITEVSELKQGACIGTSSKRRKAQLLRLRPGLKIISFRGNIDTRIDNFLKDPEIDGIVLASAGLQRIGREFNFKYIFSTNELLPAIGQGQLLSQFLSDRSEIKKLLQSISSFDSELCYLAERSLVRVLGADCHSCVGVFARVLGDQLELESVVLSEDGKTVISRTLKGDKKDAGKIGNKLAEFLINEGARELLR